MYKTKETIYIIPRTEFYNDIKSVKEFKEKYEDYIINDTNENEIENIIDVYNFEQDIKYFKKLKAKDFLFCRVTDIEIGKYKSGKIEILDLWKKQNYGKKN